VCKFWEIKFISEANYQQNIQQSYGINPNIDISFLNPYSKPFINISTSGKTTHAYLSPLIKEILETAKEYCASRNITKENWDNFFKKKVNTLQDSDKTIAEKKLIQRLYRENPHEFNELIELFIAKKEISEINHFLKAKLHKTFDNLVFNSVQSNKKFPIKIELSRFLIENNLETDDSLDSVKSYIEITNFPFPNIVKINWNEIIIEQDIVTEINKETIYNIIFDIGNYSEEDVVRIKWTGTLQWYINHIQKIVDNKIKKEEGAI